ncbi:DUF2946 family protein [uncultured Methylibium sp.]|uniref:DUF2946 family protein n=1 Tax=uncultured Methylibium sp. TaxID=381093 RepID=UPI0025CBEC59|nr:DUF2946 family protein [uncultured Methylibium sp.]
MLTVRHRLPWIARLALVATLALALLPTLSRAMAAGDASGPWAEICSSTGVKPLTDPTPTQAAGHLDHCPLCTLQDALPGLPVVEHAVQFPSVEATPTWRPVRVAAPVSGTWLRAQPRGPPAHA